MLNNIYFLVRVPDLLQLFSWNSQHGRTSKNYALMAVLGCVVWTFHESLYIEEQGIRKVFFFGPV